LNFKVEVDGKTYLTRLAGEDTEILGIIKSVNIQRIRLNTFIFFRINTYSNFSFIMSKPLIPAQRRERIQEYLVTHKIVRMDDLCSMLETSEATVRRDLEWLEHTGIVERTHGEQS